jgi:hypothetical protein
MKNRRQLTLLSGVCFSALAFAQDAASVSGSVVNSLTGAAVARAHVSLQNGQKRFGALTDGSGNFTITGLSPGESFVTVDRTGFARILQPKNVHIKAGEKTTGVELKLTPTGGITGTVFDPDGQPVQSAVVEVVGSDGEFRANTDNRGHYRLGGLSSGKYKVQASLPSQQLPPEIRSDGTKDVHYPPVYYPGASSSKAATRVTVEAGQDTPAIDMRLIASPIVRVSGRVLNAPPGPVAIDLSYWTGPNGEIGEEHEVEPDGSFIVWGVDPGKYTLKARTEGGRDAPQSATLEINVGTSNVDGIELRVAEPLAISGRIQFEDEQARAKAAPPKDLPPEEQTPHVILQPVSEGSTLSAPVGPDSTFQLEKVPPGRYRVSPGVFGAVFVKSLSWGAIQVEGNLLDTQNGSANSELVLTLSAKTAQIHGTVTDSKGPVPNASIHLMVDGQELEDVPTDEAGKYSFDEVAPGTYSILVLDKSPDEPAFFNAFQSDLSDYEDSMVKIEVHSGDNLMQDLKPAKVTK